MTRWMLAALVLAVTCAVARAEPAASPEPPTTPDATVTLPLAEFEALVGSAQQARPAGSPAAWVVREAKYACDATGTAVRVVATIAVEVLADGAHAVPVGGGGVVFEKATVDDKDVLLVPADAPDRVAVLVSGKGEHAVTVSFAVPPGGEGFGTRRLTFAVARAPITRLTLRTAEAPRQVQPASGAVVASRDTGGAHETEVLWPATEMVSVMWLDAAPAPVASSAAPPPPVLRLDGHVTARYQFRADHLAIDAHAVFHVRQGSVRELRLALPARAEFVRVRDAATDSTPPFALEKSTTGTVMVIRPQTPVSGERRFHVEARQAYPGPVPPAPASVVTTGVAATGATTDSASAGAVSTATTSVASAGTTTGTTGAVTTGLPPAGPPLEIPLAFVTLPGAEPSAGEITLVHPAAPLALDVSPEPKGTVTRVIHVQAGITGGPSFQYSGEPALAVALRNQREHPQAACEVGEVRARTLVLPEGGSVTTVVWSLQNRRAPTLTLSVPQDAQVLSAFLDNEPLRLGDRGAAAGPGGMSVRLGLTSPTAGPPPPTVPPGWRDEASAGAAPAGTAAAPVTTGTGPTGAAFGTTAVSPGPAAPAWRDLVVPLRQDPQRTWTLELVYRMKGAPLGNRDHLDVRLPRTPVEVARVSWSVDMPAGFHASVESDQLRELERVERRAEAASAATTGVARALDARPAMVPTTAPVLHAGPVAGLRFEVPEVGEGTRHPLTGDGVKAGASLGAQVTYVSNTLQQWMGALVFALTVIVVSDLFWFSFGSMVLALAGVLLLGTLLACAVLTLGVMTHLLAGLVAGLTFKLIRLVMEPVEERETT